MNEARSINWLMKNQLMQKIATMYTPDNISKGVVGEQTEWESRQWGQSQKKEEIQIRTKGYSGKVDANYSNKFEDAGGKTIKDDEKLSKNKKWFRRKCSCFNSTICFFVKKVQFGFIYFMYHFYLSDTLLFYS